MPHRLSLGTRGRHRKLNIAAMPNCEWWIDCGRADTITYSSGTNVSQVNDLSGRGRHLNKTNAGNPTVYPTYVANEKALLFLSSAFDQLAAGNIGDWNFLHNGNGCTILTLVKIDAAQSANGVILSTSSEASSGVGTNLWYQNTNQNYQVVTRNGAAQVYLNNGANNSLAKGSAFIISVHIQNRTGNPPDIITRYNGLTDIKNGPLSSYSAANSTGQLFVGKLPDAVFKPKMYFKKCAIFSRRLTKAEENRILEEWAREENISLTRYPAMDLAVISGQSNATGRGLISDTSFATTPTVSNAQIFNSSGFSWATLNAGTNNQALNSSCLGIEMNLAQQFTTLSAKPLRIIKSTADGTSITSWTSDNNNFINLQAAMQRALWNLEDDGYTVKPFFIWHQGESDAQDSVSAAAYKTRLQTFLSQILATPGFEQSPTYIVEIDLNPTLPDMATVQQAELDTSVTVPFSAYTHFVETGDIAAHLDQYHLNATSLNALGDRIVQRYLGI
jgi:hypothetical protein